MAEPTRNIEKLCPIWPTTDIGASEAFYARLGFATAYRDDGYGYLIQKREMAEVHFYLDPHHVPATSNHGGYMRLRDVDALSREWDAIGLPGDGIPRIAAAEDKPWGMREITVIDPNGHLLRVGLEIPGWEPADG